MVRINENGRRHWSIVLYRLISIAEVG